MPAVARGVLRRAFIGTYTALLKSNVKGRWKSFAASVPSGSYKPQKGQRKSKEERRAMIEAFVDKYKASNAGKFPTASHIRQEIGGSYYVIREIIQELEYGHKLSLSNKVEVVQLGKAEKVIDPSSIAKGHFLSDEKKILTSSTTAKVKSNMKSINQIVVDECSSLKDDEANVHLEANGDRAIEKPSVEEPVSPVVMVVDPSKERLQDGAQVSNRDQNSNASTSSIASEQQLVGYSKPSDKEVHSDKSSVSSVSEAEIDVSESASGQIEGNRTDISTTKFSQDMDSLKAAEQMGNHEAPKTEELHPEQPRSSEHGETSPKPASFWENLKSLTDGIINFWKKM
ncbi:putative Rhodanese-like domain-containing protein 14, chloroplastic [Cocos nucifera]|uniref:Putative Rhodanese-like domain-containing protein 14, chloroplastic n=1 Tax=Cocos nucifera TaxID=13894 RepID=A0A8K0IFY3_COCNU|nr:putative Rhodanese-like domain-containing protein 14, chloroplastic [Cocos nucifera]